MRGNTKGLLFVGISGAMLATAFCFPTQSAFAQSETKPLLKITDPLSAETSKEFLAFPETFKGGGSVAVADIGGDGVPEIIVGAGAGGGPQVRIFRTDGSVIRSFFAYPETFRGGVEVAAGDLDGDGAAEIITGTGLGGGPQVRVFDGYGNEKFTPGFFAFDSKFRGGVTVAACDLNGDGSSEIVVGSGSGAAAHVRVFDRSGYPQAVDFRPFSNREQGGVAIACANVDGGRTEELITAVRGYGSAWVKVYRGDTQRTILGSFIAFPESYQGGVNVAGGDFDGDGFDEVIVSPNTNGGPQVLAFEAHGQPLAVNYFAYDNAFRGGVRLATGSFDSQAGDDVVTMPGRRVSEGRTDYRKYIEIDISEQKLQYFENGFKIGEYTVSTGKPGMDTPLGTFKVLNKADVAYSARYQLWMPSWMAFTTQGHGLHGLPYWKLKNGGLYYEGENHLGLKVSHGCVRLPVAGAQKVNQWVEIGTPIIIHQ